MELECERASGLEAEIVLEEESLVIEMVCLFEELEPQREEEREKESEWD